MANITIQVGGTFATGETVGAYPADKFSTPPAGAPPEAATSTAVVASNGTLTFTGLTENASYFAYAGSPVRYVRFRVDQVTDDSDPSGFLGAYESLPAGTEVTANQVVSYANKLYSRNARGVVSGAFDPANWTPIAASNFSSLADMDTATTLVDGNVIVYNSATSKFRGIPATANTAAVNVINVKAYGATGNGTTDDTAAITAAFTAAGKQDVIVYFPPGIYKDTAQRDFSASKNLRILGGGAVWGPQELDNYAGHHSTEWRYTGTSAPFINAHDSNHLSFEGIAVTVSNASFTGDIVDCRINRFLSTRDSFFGGSSNTVMNARTAMLLSGVAWADFDTTGFGRCVHGVWGIDTTVTNGGYSNAITFKSCSFTQTQHIAKNPNNQWAFYGCVFECYNAANSPGGITAPILCDVQVNGLLISGCGFWDLTSPGGGPWIQSTVGVNGISVIGCSIACVVADGSFFQLAGPASGILFSGNNCGGNTGTFAPLITMTSGGHRGSSAPGNWLGPYVDNTEAGVQNINKEPFNQGSAAYTLQLKDAGCQIQMSNSGSATTVTIPRLATVAWTVGTTIRIVASAGVYNTNIVAGTGVTLHDPYSKASIPPLCAVDLVNLKQSDHWAIL